MTNATHNKDYTILVRKDSVQDIMDKNNLTYEQVMSILSNKVDNLIYNFEDELEGGKMTELIEQYYAWAGDSTSPSEMLDFLEWKGADRQTALEYVESEFDLDEEEYNNLKGDE